MHYGTALSGLKSVKYVGVISGRTFFHRHFLRELIGFSRIAHIVFTIDS